VTPRGTDWSLAALVALLAVTGALTALAGTEGGQWVFAAHGAGGFALAAVLAWKARRVWGRLSRPRRWRGPVKAGVLAAALVVATLGSGWAWASGYTPRGLGYNLLNLHVVLGVALALGVLGHALIRARRPRRADVTDRRQFLTAAAVGAGSLLAWQLQRPAQRALGWRGAARRFTGSYDRGGAGNAFPTTSWVADRPRELDPRAYRLAVAGAVERPLELTAAELASGGDELTATLDCTGGFYATRRWRGTSLGALLDRAGATGGHVRVISHTGYRWSFSAGDARGCLLATHVGSEPLNHGHGAPVRLVAPGRRGFQWIKWVVRVELHDGPDLGAPASTLWSSFTPEGRGEA
jgi:DMSO/TMAO reductase YedYZ molybdopterin-dependent catalytic subunit